MKKTKTGGEALVDGLLSHGIDTIFGLPGVQNDHFGNYIPDVTNKSAQNLRFLEISKPLIPLVNQK